MEKMSVIKYKITFKMELLNSWTILLYFVGFSALPIYRYYRYPENDILVSIGFSIIGFLVIAIPQCIIHLKYYSLNQDIVMEYDTDLRKISIVDTKKSKVSTFTLEDVNKIHHYMSYPLAENRGHWLPWDSYNYSKIYLKNGEMHIVTSLLVYKLQLPIKEKYEMIKTFYAYPNFS
jgi:hypothetical protein